MLGIKRATWSIVFASVIYATEPVEPITTTTTTTTPAPPSRPEADVSMTLDELKRKVDELIAETTPPRAFIGDIGLSGTEKRIGLLPQVNEDMLEDTKSLNPLNDDDVYQRLVKLTVINSTLPRIEGHAYWEASDPDLQLKCGGFTTGGEDAYFFNDTTCVFGVADGVGATQNSAPFAKALCSWAEKASQFYGRGGYGHNSRDPEVSKAIMNEATRMSQEEAHPRQMNITQASVMASTMVIGMLDDTNHYNIANMGDSGISVYRRRAESRYLRTLALQTTGMQGGWNMPLALSSVPALTADHAESYYAPAEIGDLIIAASDGVYDAMFEPEIAALVTRSVSPIESQRLAVAENVLHDVPWRVKLFGEDTTNPDRYATPPDQLAKYLVLAARWHQANSKSLSPFDVSVLHEGARFPTNAKPDDTTAVVCWVV